MKNTIFILLLLSITVLFTACPEKADVIPIACFDSSSSEVTTGEQVTFENCSQDAEYYSWDFGDGGTSNEVEPTYSYTQPGEYTIVLTAHNNSNKTTDTKTIQVIGNNINPEDYNGIPNDMFSNYYSEDFNSDTTLFLFGEDDEYRTTELLEGFYRVSVIDPGYDYIFYAPYESPDSDADFEIEIRVRYSDYSDFYGSGLLWGKNPDDAEFYYYFVYPNGDYLAGYYKADWYMWIDITAGANPEPQWNKVTLRKFGNYYYGFLNEQLVFKEDYNGIYGKYYGLYVATASVVDFDYFYSYTIDYKKSRGLAKPIHSKIKSHKIPIKQLKN